jgi:quercetin dioxygenase-like cupin family protein
MKRAMLSIRTMFAAMVLLFIAAGVSAAQDPLSVGGGMYKKVFENERIRVMEVTFKPGESIAVHSHPDHFVYALTGGMLSVSVVGGKTEEMNLKPGDTGWMPAQSHSAKNNSKSTLKVLVVELKEKMPAKH